MEKDARTNKEEILQVVKDGIEQANLASVERYLRCFKEELNRLYEERLSAPKSR